MNVAKQSSYRVTVPSSELPVSLEQARQQLRNEDLNYDDEYIRGLIRSAADYMETTYGLALLTQTVEQTNRTFPCDNSVPLMLRVSPVSGITKVEYIDSDGEVREWDSDEYSFGHFNGRAFLTPKVGFSWPTTVTTQHPQPITITYLAGYGKPIDIPRRVQQALLMGVYDYYTNRGDPPRNLMTATDRIMMSLYPFSC